MADDLGFRIVGPCTGERRLVCWPTAFVAYASLDARAEVEREAYLSAFTFGDDFRTHLEATGSTAGFAGVCGGEFVWFDIDRTDLDISRSEAARLAWFITERYRLDDDALLIFFSGSKGFHVGLPTELWKPAASLLFNGVAKRLAEGLAASCEVVIDLAVYDKVRAFRAPNSRHGKTGLHKLRLSLNELTRLSVESIQRLASEPKAFDVPTVSTRCDQAATDWQEAATRVEQATEATRQRRASTNDSARLNRATMDFINGGASTVVLGGCESRRVRLLGRAGSRTVERSRTRLGTLAERDTTANRLRAESQRGEPTTGRAVRYDRDSFSHYHAEGRNAVHFGHSREGLL